MVGVDMKTYWEVILSEHGLVVGCAEGKIWDTHGVARWTYPELASPACAPVVGRSHVSLVHAATIAANELYGGIASAFIVSYRGEMMEAVFPTREKARDFIGENDDGWLFEEHEVLP